MLYHTAVKPEVLELLTTIQKDSFFADFSLAGGTSLALQIGHRFSVDLDFFTQKDFQVQTLTEKLEKEYGFIQTFISKNTLKGIINNVHIEFITHKYPLIQEITKIEDLRFYSKQDISAMKINAISVDGTRVKDFVDIYFLMQDYSIKEMINFYERKYSQKNAFHALKSLVWFEDIELSEWPVLVRDTKLTWSMIKEKIEHEVILLKKF